MIHHWEVTEEESGLKLIDFIKEKMGESYSARAIKREIENNACLINGRTQRFAATILGHGDRIQFHITNELKIVPNRSILYEDRDLIIINKPPGFPSENAELGAQGTFLVHRLDKMTSGALLYAKNEKTKDALIEIFRQKKMHKVYKALVDGVMTGKKGTIDNYLGKLNSYQGQAIWGEVPQTNGLRATTLWRLEKQGKQAALLECIPITGRTHQIRAHLNGLGHPILGDYQYGRNFFCTYRPSRCMLHAWKLEFAHPSTGAQIKVEAPLPGDFKETLKIIMAVDSERL